MVILSRVLVLCFITAMPLPGLGQGTTSWVGDGATSAWSDAANWTPAPPQSGSGNTLRDLHFGAAWLASPAGQNFVSSRNDLADFRGHSIVFDSAAPSPFFIITGNGITLSDLGGSSPSIIGNSVEDVQTVDLDPGQILRFDGGSTGAAEVSGRSFIDFKMTAIQLLGTTTLRVVGDASIAIRGSLSASGGLTADSTHDVALFGAAKSYTGATLVKKGRLVVAAPVTSSAITVQAGAELFAFRQNGIQAQMTTVRVEGGVFSGYDYQATDVTLIGGSYHMRLVPANQGGFVGSIALGGARLVLDAGSEFSLTGTRLIENDGVDPIQGRFVDENGTVLEEGSMFTSQQNGKLVRISYSAGTGNDIWLYEIPEPTTVSALLLSGGLLLVRRRPSNICRRF
jgi:hypothetical protein